MASTWSRLPILRTYAELRTLRKKNGLLRDEVLTAREERDRARRILTQPLSSRQMKDLVAAHGSGYRAAAPFPHVVLDNVFEPELLRQVLHEFDAVNPISWSSSDKELERKRSTEDVAHFGPTTRVLITQ